MPQFPSFASRQHMHVGGADAPSDDHNYSSLEAPLVDRLLTAEEIAQRLGVRTQWVWAQARAGRIPHVRLGRYRRFRESAVEAWVCELEAESTSIDRDDLAAPHPAALTRLATASRHPRQPRHDKSRCAGRDKR
jgi:excisionase family DNA binding protein